MKKMVAKKGFTLIELLIVITIIGILAAALLPSILGAPARARDASRIADINQIVTALETYAADNGSYPAADADFCVPAALNSYFQGGAAPSDPSKLKAGKCTADTGYVYCQAASPNNYVLGAVLEVAGGQGSTTKAGLSGLVCDGTDSTATTTLPLPAGNEAYAIVK